VTTNTRSFDDAAKLLLRVALGSMWISHALLKVVVFTMPGFAGFLASQGFPTFAAWPIVLAEIIGGAAILSGVYGRYASIALLPIMLGAAWTHLGNGWVFSNAGGGWEYPIFLAVISVVHALLGDGKYVIGFRRPVPLAHAARSVS
jgi:putative oxidoreductase